MRISLSVVHDSHAFETLADGDEFARHSATCIFLSTKTENEPLALELLVGKLAKLGVTRDDVLKPELLLSQSLKFEYKVHHAHVALKGMLFECPVRLQRVL